MMSLHSNGWVKSRLEAISLEELGTEWCRTMTAPASNQGQDLKSIRKHKKNVLQRVLGYAVTPEQ